MKKILVGMVGVALVSGCSTASVENVSYPVQREENVLNKILPAAAESPTTEPWVEKKLSAWSELSEEMVSEPESLPSPSASSQPKTSATISSNPVQPTQEPVEETVEEVIEEPQDLVSLTTFVDNVDICKIPEYTWTGPHAKGFPIRNNDVPYQGKVTIAVVFIDFSNATSEGMSPLSEYQKELNNSIAWSKFYSGGAMEYDLMLYPKWFRAPKEAQEYPIRKANVEHAAIQDWVSVADDYYDFSKSHFIYFIVPEKAHFELGADMYGVGKATTNDGPIQRRVFTYYAPPKLIWSHMVHEVLHDQGFIGHGPANGSAYGIMMGQWYNSQSVLSWPSFMAGWLDGQDIVCIDARDGIEEASIKLNSLDKLGASGGIKSIIIRTGDTTASVVEYRTDGPFSTLRKEMHGITVYNLDTSKPSNRCDSCGAQQYQDEKNWWNYIRIPGVFDGRGNNNFNFTSGTIPGTYGFKVKISNTNTITISE